MENGQFEEAEESFVKALFMSKSRERDLEGLFGIYQGKGHTEELFEFYNRIRNKFPLSDKMDILLARALMNLKRYDKARRILKNLNEKKPSAEAYGKARKLFIAKDYYHKAMDLDPKNKDYRKRYDALQKRLAFDD
jgi:tetratricopeptide (TPR) repeat protein